jgi:hypothetical protein
MEFWKNRFIIPGWMLMAAFVVFGRSIHLNGAATLGAVLVGESSLGAVLVGLASGPLVGFLVDSAWETAFRALHISGRFVDFSRLRSGLLDVLRALPSKKRARLHRTEDVLRDETHYDDRTVYTLTWWAHAPAEYRLGCHRRWEVYHATRASILALVTGAVLAFCIAATQGDAGTFWYQNATAFPAGMVIVLILFVFGRRMAVEAGQHENAWIARCLDSAESDPAWLECLAQARPQGAPEEADRR